MNRDAFAHSRVWAEYDDGPAIGTCSLRCAAIDLAFRLGRAPKVLQVGDYSSHQLIDAASAHWVIGGDLPGVMARQATWAFATREAADAFRAAHGGTAAAFGEALKTAFGGLTEEILAGLARRGDRR
jgi:hypothetical protein